MSYMKKEYLENYKVLGKTKTNFILAMLKKETFTRIQKQKIKEIAIDIERKTLHLNHTRSVVERVIMRVQES